MSKIKSEKNIPTHVVFVGAFVQKGNKFLLARRSRSDPQAGGNWSVPGGKVDMDLGEKVLEKDLKREIMEEVGLEIKDDIDLIGNDAFIRVSGHHVIGLTFLCKWKKGVAKPLEDQDEVRWVTLSEMGKMKDMPKYLKPRIEYLRDYLKRHEEM